MSRYVWIVTLVSILFPVMIATAADTERDPRRSRLGTDKNVLPIREQPVRSDMTGKHAFPHAVPHDVPFSVTNADTIYLLGGPDRLDGTFQTAGGEPDWHGWTSEDRTLSEAWHIDTYNCSGLDPTEPDNHAWWCGLDYASCSSGDPPGGYGNQWLEQLDWIGTVANPALAVTVRVTAMLNYDTEEGYDNLDLGYETLSGFHSVATFTGSNKDDSGIFFPVVVDTGFTLTPADYVGAGADQVHLRWRFSSDFNASDADCWYQTSGAAQIDLIQVFFDQGGGEVPIGPTETCEPGDAVQWGVVLATGCGDFAKIWPYLNDIDPCHYNVTPQVAFIDDGLVVPGTGGYLCTSWCYGPSGYIVNPAGGLRGPEFYIHNAILSPVLQWPGEEYHGATFACDVYLHESGPTSPGMLFFMQIRSTNDPSGETGWTGWYLVSNVGYAGGPHFRRMNLDAAGNYLDDRTYVQLALGVIQVPFFMSGTDGTPAPYIDNVSFKVFASTGPRIETQLSWDLAQDNFPEIGTIDYENLGANHIRFDAAYWDLGNWDGPMDRVWFRAVPVRTGAVLNDHPRMYYKLKANPLFDPYRTSGLPNAGFVYADSASSAGTWVAELPDSAFFYPGDVIHYYIEAQDNVGGDIGTTRMPADTTGFSVFRGDAGYVPMLYPPEFVVRGLPTLWDASPDSQPDILLWNDRWEEPFTGHNDGPWTLALANLGFQEGVDYDLFWSTAKMHDFTAGLGGWATASQLANYETLLYTSGTDDVRTMTDGWETGMTVACLHSWLLTGNKNMFLTGDNFIYDMLFDGSAATIDFINNWVSVSYVQQDLRPLIDNQASPLVKAIAGNPIFFALNEWIAYGGCPDYNNFDALVPAGSAISLAEFTNASGQGGVYPFAAAVYYHRVDFNADVITLPYDFNFILTPQGGRGKAVSPSAARTRLLEEVLLSFGHMGSSAVTGLPEADVFSVKSYPNPFNPSTKIYYHMPQRGELTIKIYNVRGELVRTVIDEVVAAGDGSVLWDGSDGRGQAVASGVYFYETKTLGEVHVNKMALVK